MAYNMTKCQQQQQPSANYRQDGNCVGIFLYNKLEQKLDEDPKMCAHTRMFTLTPCSCGLCLCESDPSIPSDPRDVSRASVCWANCPAASWKTVDFDVFWQVVTAGKLLLTYKTLVGLDPRVGPAVSRQLIRPWKPGRKKRFFFVFDTNKLRKSEVWTWIMNLMILHST